MKIWMLFLLVSLPVYSQSLSAEDQNRMKEENAMLKKENQQLKDELLKLKGQSKADMAKMMEVLQKGKKYQEDQLKALEELEKEQ